MKKLFILILCGLFLVIVSRVEADDNIYTYEGMMRGTTIKAVQKYKLNYSGNSAYMFMYSDSECQYSRLSFNTQEFTQKEGKGAPVKNSPTGILNMSSENNCTGAYSSGFAEIELSTFNVDSKVNKAYAKGTSTLYTWEYESRDDTTPDYIVKPINIEVTWTGIGDMYKGHNRYRDRSSSQSLGTYSYSYSFTGSYRDAQAMGSITGNAMTAIELVSDNANIQKAKEGYLAMEKINKN